MKVADLMTPATVSDSPDDTLADASKKMWAQQTGSLLVMERSKLIGIITERDCLRAMAEGDDPTKTSVRDTMTKDVVTIGPGTKLRDAAAIMFDHWFRHLPVATEQGDVVGIISLRDLLSVVAQGMDEPEALTELTGHSLVRDRRLERIEAGDLD
jgi:CBS domain-containing protein